MFVAAKHQQATQVLNYTSTTTFLIQRVEKPFWRTYKPCVLNVIWENQTDILNSKHGGYVISDEVQTEIYHYEQDSGRDNED